MIRTVTETSPLKILGFTDCHLDDNGPCGTLTLKLIRETVESEKPDLIVFVGDTVTGGCNRERAEIFAALMTSLGTPWCAVLGNHEGDNPLSVSRAEMVEIFRTSPCCLIPDNAGAAPGRYTDYVIDLRNDAGEICHKLIFLDGGTDMTDEEMARYGLSHLTKRPDNCLTEAQIGWYREQVRKTNCPSTVFCHIPLPEFAEGFEKGELLAGNNLERICHSPYNSGMFAAMCEEGRTTAFVCGHDHINDSHLLYKGVRLIYNRMSGLSSYNVISKKLGNKLLQGCTVYTIHADGTAEYGDIFYEDRYPQYREEIYRVIRK